jgi:hypothetical protein
VCDGPSSEPDEPDPLPRLPPWSSTVVGVLTLLVVGVSLPWSSNVVAVLTLLVVGVSLPWSSKVVGVFPPWSSNVVGVSLPWSSTVLGVLDVVARGCVVVDVPPSKREMSAGSGVVLTEDAAAIAPTPASPMAAAATAVVIKDFFMAGAPLAMRRELTSSPSPRVGAVG